MRRAAALLAVAAALAVAIVTVPAPAPARALTIPSPVCTVAGLFNGLAGNLCKGLAAGTQLLSGGGSGAARGIGVAAVLTGIVLWVTKGSQAALRLTAHFMSVTTRPQLQSSWFSASYWRMAAIAMLLTIPFLLAACVQAVLRSDVAMIGQAALGYLPLAVLATMIAAPVTTLLLAASDELCALISGAAGAAPGAALSKLTVGVGLTLLTGSSFVALIVGLITVAAAMTLWIELLIRSAAVYVIVLMLPVMFAALVWPARRVWAMRGVELLIALILSKFAIVAVLSLGASAIGQGVFGGLRVVAGATLVLLAAFSPWAVIRLIPMHELAAGAAAWTPHLRHPVSSALGSADERGEGAAAASPGAVSSVVPSIVAALGPGRHRGDGLVAAEVARSEGTDPVTSGDVRPEVTPETALAASSATGEPGAAAPAPGTEPASSGGPAADADPFADPFPPPPETEDGGYDPDNPSIIFGTHFASGTPAPGEAAPRPIRDMPDGEGADAGQGPAEAERVDPPLPPEDEHGTGPL